MTREEAIEIITNTMFIGSSADDIDTAINMAIEALEQTRWIPVSEELPKLCEEVIVTDVETSDTYLSRYIGNEYWECDNGSFKNRIIAWQPKPKPYKEESEKI